MKPIPMNVHQELFRSSAGESITRKRIGEVLRQLDAADCNILYVHSGLGFGLPSPFLRRSELLGEVYGAFADLAVRTICVPTFTFSFCNGLDFDVEKSRSKMGALNEYIRQIPGSIRSIDPLMSVCITGADRDIVDGIGHESVGKYSTFDRLCGRDGVKFLFFGVRPGDCFTYMHYLEWLAGVKYRYNRVFSGTITQNGRTWQDNYTLFVRYNNVRAGNGSYAYEDILRRKGILRELKLGDATVSCVDEAPARLEYLSLLEESPSFFIEEPFIDGTGDSVFSVKDMVAL